MLLNLATDQKVVFRWGRSFLTRAEEGWLGYYLQPAWSIREEIKTLVCKYMTLTSSNKGISSTNIAVSHAIDFPKPPLYRKWKIHFHSGGM